MLTNQSIEQRHHVVMCSDALNAFISGIEILNDRKGASASISLRDEHKLTIDRSSSERGRGGGEGKAEDDCSLSLPAEPALLLILPPPQHYWEGARQF